MFRFLQELKSLLQEEFGANPLLKKKKQMFSANRFQSPGHIKVIYKRGRVQGIKLFFMFKVLNRYQDLPFRQRSGVVPTEEKNWKNLQKNESSQQGKTKVPAGEEF